MKTMTSFRMFMRVFMLLTGILAATFFARAQSSDNGQAVIKESVKAEPADVQLAQVQPELSLNLLTTHLWRGIEVADGWIFTTDLSIADPKKHLRAGVWGAMSTDGSFKEFDYYLTYNLGGFHVYVWDVFNFSPDADYNNREFFNYKAHETGRFVDVTVGYTFRKIPLTLNWSTIVFGRDRDALNAQNRYSTYVFAEYSVYNKNKWKVDLGLGGAFALSKGKNMEGKRTSESFYGDKPGIVQVSLKTTYDLTLFKQKFPVFVMLMGNPLHNTGFMQLGIQLFSF